MTTVADDIWAILHEVARGQKELQGTQKELQSAQKALQDAQKETDREIKAVSASVGRLSNRLGQFVEEAVRPSAVRLFSQRGIDVHEVYQNVTAKREGEGLEIDLLVVNNQDAVIIECKSNLSLDDVNEHLQRLEKVKRLMPSYREKRISGAVAGMVIPENVAAYAIRKGLYVIGQNGDHLELELRNNAAFVAKVW